MAPPDPRPLGTTRLGLPRVHFRRIDSTNARARTLAAAGTPHGTLVTASEQTAGRGRQGRTWSAPAGRALLMSLLLRDPPPLLPLAAGVAVCDAARAAGATEAGLKWPNDLVLATASGGLAKFGGILVEGRPQEEWSVLGIGVNVALRPENLPAELAAASLELDPAAVETVLELVLEALTRRLAEPAPALLDAWRARDALHGRELEWSGGRGRGAGVDEAGRLVVIGADGQRTALDAGEVHLGVGAVAPG